MKILKKLSCFIIAVSMLLPYTAFSADNIERGTGRIENTSPSYYDEGISMMAAQAPLDQTEIEMFKYVVSRFAEFDDVIDLSMYSIPVERFKYIYGHFIAPIVQLEHPELFYVDLESSYQYISNGEYITSVSANYRMSESEARAAQAMIEAETQKVVLTASELNTDLEKALYVHDYITQNYSYDTSYSSYTIDSMVARKTGVCQGYSHLYYIIMNALGIPCVNVPNVYNDAVETGHMWNKIMIDNEWYNVDVTFDDPISEFSTSGSHDYFLLNDEQIRTRDIETRQLKNEHAKIAPKKWDGITDAEVSHGDTSKFYGFINMVGASVYKDGAFWCLNSNNDICKVKFEGNIVIEPRFTRVEDYRWNIWDYSYLYIGGYFSNLALYNNKVYFNTPNTIYEFDTENNNLIPAYTYDGPSNVCNTYFYGLRTADGALYVDYTELHYDESTGGVSVLPITQITVFEASEPTETIAPDPTEEPTPEPTEEPTPEPTEEPTPEPTEEPFPTFDEPLPCVVEETEIREVYVVDESTGEEITAYEVEIAVSIPEEVSQASEEYSKPVTVKVAQYSDEGTFLGFAEAELTTDGDNRQTASFTADNNCESIKTFVWYGFIMPLAMADSIGLGSAATTE